jgi:hypothetical protein
VLARRRGVAYDGPWHSRVLRTMGMDAATTRNLLDGAHGLPDADEAVTVLAAAPADMPGWAEPGPVADALLRAAVSVHLRDGDRPRLAPQLRRVIPAADHDHVVLLLGYVETCLQWAEAHPPLSLDADPAASTDPGRPPGQVPELADGGGLPAINGTSVTRRWPVRALGKLMAGRWTDPAGLSPAVRRTRPRRRSVHRGVSPR